MIDEVPGVNVVTTGPLFTLLKLLGVDIGWVPPLPNSVADEINNTDYLTVGADDLLGTIDVGLLQTALQLLGVRPQ